MAGFAAILFCPGYVAGSALNLFGFRQRSAAERAAWAVALSFAISPILVTLACRGFSLKVAAALLVAVTAGAAYRLVRDGRRVRLRWNGETALLAGILLAGAAIVLDSLVDFQYGDALYPSVTVLDQMFRTAFIRAVWLTGVPPVNPVYHPGQAEPLRYYYFWYVLCAACRKLVPVTGRQALFASSAWSGFGLAAVIALFVRHFLGVRERVGRQVTMSVLLLGVTGADLIPTAAILLTGRPYAGDMEWWSGDQITSWYDSVVWVPNHVASLVACLTCFLLLWRCREAMSRGGRMACVGLAGAAAASGFGLSVYVTAGFGMVMLCWAGYVGLRERDWKTGARGAGAVAIAGVLLIPYAREIIAAPSGTQGGRSAQATHLLRMRIREIIDPGAMLAWTTHSRGGTGHGGVVGDLTRLVLLIPGYGLELGVYGLVLMVLLVRVRGLDEPQRQAVFLSVCGLALVSFVGSSVIGNDDFGYRAAMLPCFFLLLLTGDLLVRERGRMAKPMRQGMTALLVLGAAGTAFQALSLRMFLPFAVAVHAREFKTKPMNILELYKAYPGALRDVPADALVQPNPTSEHDYFYVMNMLYLDRMTAVDGAEDCGAVFGGDPGRCGAARNAVRRLYARPAPRAAEAISTCRGLGIAYLAATRTEASWEDRTGWVWTLPLAGGSGTDDGFLRVVDCRGDMPPGR